MLKSEFSILTEVRKNILCTNPGMSDSSNVCEITEPAVNVLF